MNQLLIIDIQNTYKDHISQELIQTLPGYAKNFSNLIYLYDNISGEEFESEVLAIIGV